MHFRHSPAGSERSAVSPAGAGSSRVRPVALSVLAAAMVASGGCGGATSVPDAFSFIIGADPAPEAAAYRPLAGEKRVREYVSSSPAYEGGLQCAESHPPSSCPADRIDSGSPPVDVARNPDEDPDRAGAVAPASSLGLSLPSGNPAPVASTRLQAPAAYGALGERLSGLSVVAFDASNSPSRFPLSDFVHESGERDPALPEFLTRGPGDTVCHPLLHLAPDLVCSPSAGSGSLYALASPDGNGASLRFADGLSFSAFTRYRGRLDGVASGAFSFEAGSALAALRLDRAWALDETGRWSMEGAFTLAADLPRAFGERRASMLEAGPALLSDWTIGVTHRTPLHRYTRLSISQPPRAETGYGVLTLPSGQREDGTRTYRTHRFSLVPPRRELTLRLAHQRPFAGGDLVFSLLRTRNQGHSLGPKRHIAGVAWRLNF